MERSTAEAIACIVQDCSARTDSSVKQVLDTCSTEVFEEYRMLAGSIMGNMFTEILGPIWTEHEDLAPDWFREQSKANAERSKPTIDARLRDAILALMDDIESGVARAVEIAENAQDHSSVAKLQEAKREIVGYVDAVRYYVKSLGVTD